MLFRKRWAYERLVQHVRRKHKKKELLPYLLLVPTLCRSCEAKQHTHKHKENESVFLSVSGDAPKKLVSQTHVTFRAHSFGTILSILIPTEEVWVRIFPRRKTGENSQKNTIAGYSVYSEQTAIPSVLLLGAELTEYYSVHSVIRIGPKRTQLPSIPCILIPE